MGGGGSRPSYEPQGPTPQQIATQNQTNILGQDTNRLTWQNQYDAKFADLYNNQQALDSQNAQAKNAAANGGAFNVDPTLQGKINADQSWINSNPWQGFNWGGINTGSDPTAQGQMDAVINKWKSYVNPTQQLIDKNAQASALANQQSGAQAAASSVTGLNAPQGTTKSAVSAQGGSPTSAQLFALSDQNQKKNNINNNQQNRL